ncbi:Unknown protein [Striga hermonthica]|uniref:Reverse transcriptase zinc-binding domain-containing protein n=1 Tax=Striga hermonthica TaxID=68872 RepID=A0A9N7N959_STRHE|nr:Unknown protein [Striga hermonthica]
MQVARGVQFSTVVDGELAALVRRNAVVVFTVGGCCMGHVVKQLLLGLGVGPAVVELEGHTKKIPSGSAIRNPNIQWVQQLFQDNRRSWNKELVESTFLPDEAKAILQMKDLDPHKPDSLRWVGDSKGKFIVADTYKSLIDIKWKQLDIPSSSTIHKEIKETRQRTWSLKIKRKIRHFIWRGLNNILPVLVNLNSRGSRLDHICSLCGEAEESQEHMFFLCRRAQHIWKLAPISWEGLHSETDSFKHWWIKLCSINKSKIVEDRVQLTCYLLWWMWKTRNLWVFQNVWRSEIDTVRLALAEWREFQSCSL